MPGSAGRLDHTLTYACRPKGAQRAAVLRVVYVPLAAGLHEFGVESVTTITKVKGFRGMVGDDVFHFSSLKPTNDGDGRETASRFLADLEVFAT